MWLFLFLIVPAGFISLGFVLSSVSEQSTKPEVAPVERRASTGNVAHDDFMPHSESEQAMLLGQIVEDSCAGNRAFYMGMDSAHDAIWSVGCTNGRSYEILIHPDATGSTKVLECSVVKAVLKIDCFVKLEGQ
jgi:hypothetical protein